jgi:hypothetical protein
MIPEKAIKKVRNDIHLEIAAGSLLAYGVFPQTAEGIQRAKETAASKDTWLAPSDLPEYYANIDDDLLKGRENDAIRAIRRTLKEFYGIEKPSSAGTVDFIDTSVVEGETQIYKPADKFVDDGKEFADKIVTDLDEALEETSNQIMDNIDDFIESSNKEYEDFKKQLNRKVDHPELYPELQHIQPRYMWGQHGLYDLEFKSDIDRAIYFAGKLGKTDTPDKIAVRAWLMEVTGLDVRGDYEKVKDYRTRILKLILQLIKLHPNERDVIVPPVYDGYYQDPDDEEDEEDEEDYEDLEEDFDGLDDLLNEVRNEEQISEKEVADNIEEEIIDAAEDEEDPMADADVDIQAILDGDEDETKSITEKLTDTINKPKKESSYASNKKILDSITVNFGRIQETLNIVNRNLEEQNTLIRANIDTQLAVGDLISNQTDLLASKFDLILEHFERQLQHSEELDEVEKRKANESKLEAQRDAAGSSDFQDLTKKPSGKKRENKIEKYLKGKLTRKLYRKLPKSVRNARQKVRKLQRVPGKAKAKAVSKMTSMLPTKGKQAVGTMSKIRGMGRVGRMAGPARYAFAGLEYGERKAEGQSELQAQAGVGSGLAGAGIGAGLVSAGVALLPTAPTGWGAVAAGSLILLGSILGGAAASGAADKITGADKVIGEHETGGLTKPGTALLHGTEAIINRDAIDMSPLNTLGGIMIASTTEYINSAGAVAAPIAPSLRGVSTQMARQYDVPATLAQTNVGGTLPKLDNELRKVREKRKETPEEELEGMEKDLLQTQDEKSFFDKLLKIIDPDGKFQELLKKINVRKNDTTDFDLELIGDGAFDTGLRTGPSGVIGGSADYHQDLSFGPGVSIEDQRKLILQLAVAYDKSGRKMELSNEGVGGRVFPVNGTKEEQIKWIEDARAAHRARNGGTGRDAIDFYTPLKNEDRFGKSVENTAILAPVVEGGQRKYSSGGAGGAGITITDKEGKEILKIIHGRTDIPLPTGGAMPSVSVAKPAPAPANNLPAAATQTTPTQQVSSTPKVGEQLAAQTNDNMDGMVAATYGAGVPKTPRWMQEIERQYNEVKDKPFSPGTPKPGRGMGDTWMPQASIDRGNQIASLSRYEQESESNTVLINNQSPSMPAMPSSGGTEIIQMGGASSSELLKSLMLQRLNA